MRKERMQGCSMTQNRTKNVESLVKPSDRRISSDQLGLIGAWRVIIIHRLDDQLDVASEMSPRGYARDTHLTIPQKCG